jgi:outer membrane receptor protein involved in Fe transport
VQYSGFTGEENSPVFKYEIGLRGEQVWNDGNTAGNQIAFSNNYFNLFPTANLAYYKQSNEFWKLSYGRRINRPWLGQLNPFVDITDSLNQQGGNPYLKPELVHSFELGYNKDWEKLSISSVLYYRTASNTIRGFTVLRPDGVAISKPANFGNVVTYGVENIFSAKPSNKYDFNLSVSLFQQNIENGNTGFEVANNVFSWYGKLINNFALWGGSKLQITGVYNAPIALPQGKRIAIYNVDLGLQQKLGKGNVRLGLVVTDIFNTQKSGQLLTGSNFTYNRIAKVDTRAVLVTFVCTFGGIFKEKLLENKFSND